MTQFFVELISDCHALRDALRDAQIKDEMHYGSTKQFELKNLGNTF